MTALFKTDDILTKDVTENVSGKKTVKSNASAHRTVLSYILPSAFGEDFSPLNEKFDGKDVHFVSEGDWSMHELLEFILLQCGPAEIWFSAWSFSEESARTVFRLMEEGLISKCSAVIDQRAENRNPVAYQIAKSVLGRVVNAPCHAKVTVIRAGWMDFTIVGSANYTRNPRIEAGVVSFDKGVADFHVGWIERLLDGGKLFEELYGGN